MFSIRVCSLFEIETQKDFNAGYMVSILDPDLNADAIRPSWIPKTRHVVFTFADYTCPAYPDGPTPVHVKDLIALARELNAGEPDARILIHCAAGVSRSPATAYLFFAVQLGRGAEERALEETLRSCVNDWISPNRLIVRYADELLERDGLMLDTLDRWMTLQS